MDSMETEPKKPSAVMLDMAKHPIPREMFMLLGRKCLFAYSVSHLSLLAITFGYSNIVTFYRFGVYSSLMTPNSISIAVSYYNKQYNDSVFTFCIIASHLAIGISLDCFLLNSFKSREHTFGILMILLMISSIMTDQIVTENGVVEGRYIVCFLSAVLGAISHWTSKLGYIVMLFDGNFMKFVESNYKYLSGYSQGGPKQRGDNVIVSVILTSAFIGVILGLVALRHVERLSLTLMIVMCPLQLHCSGCLEVWGAYNWQPLLRDRYFHWLRGRGDQSTKEVEMASNDQPMGLHEDHATIAGTNFEKPVDNSVGTVTQSPVQSAARVMSRDSILSSRSSWIRAGRMDSRGSLSLLHNFSSQLHFPTGVFDRMPLQPRQIEQYEDLMKAFGHKAELSQIV